MKSLKNKISKYFVLLLYFSTIALPSFSQVQENKNSTHSISTNNGHNSIIINDNDGYLEIKYTGDITFNDDETALKTISSDGFLFYKKHGKSIKASIDGTGLIYYEVNGGARKTALDKSDSEFLASAIKTMIDHGIGAKNRVERIFNKSGSRGVLNEIGNIRTDYVKGIYLNYLLSTNTLTNNEMTEIANNIKNVIKSDYEKGKLLSRFSDKYLTNNTTANAYLAAVNSIDSDYEKAKAIKIILKQPLLDAQLSEVLKIVSSIDSDYEKSGVIKTIVKNNKLSDLQFSEVLKLTSSITSDYEKGNILKAVFKNKLPESQFNQALATATSIGADYEKTNVLKQLAATEITAETDWISLINAAEKISSNYEKSNLLIKIAEQMKITDKTKEAYAKAAKTISSDYEYGRALRALN